MSSIKSHSDSETRDEPVRARSEPVRARLMRQGINLTCGDRNAAYGDPAINMGCAGALKAVVRDFAERAGRAIPPDENEALDMVLTKISRFVTGAVTEDTFVDGSTYFAILGELALGNKAKLS